MKKSTYQKPELTIVSFKSERGFADSETPQEKTFSLGAMLGMGDGEVGDERDVIATDSWTTGW